MPEGNTARLFQLIGKGEPVGAIVLVGTDPYLRDLCRNKVIEAYVPVEDHPALRPRGRRR